MPIVATAAADEDLLDTLITLLSSNNSPTAQQSTLLSDLTTKQEDRQKGSNVQLDLEVTLSDLKAIPGPDADVSKAIELVDVKIKDLTSGKEDTVSGNTYPAPGVASGYPAPVTATVQGSTTESKVSFIIKEARLTETKDPNVFKVVIIEAGESLNGRYYDESTLDAAIPLFEGKSVHAFAFKEPDGSIRYDHPPEAIRADHPGGLIHYKAAFLENVEHIGRQLVADFHVLQPWLRNICSESIRLGKSLIGLSIDADGEIYPKRIKERVVNWVKRLTGVYSVDVVSEPAAGGRLLLESILESHRSNPEDEKLERHFMKELNRLTYQDALAIWPQLTVREAHETSTDLTPTDSTYTASPESLPKKLIGLLKDQTGQASVSLVSDLGDVEAGKLDMAEVVLGDAITELQAQYNPSAQVQEALTILLDLQSQYNQQYDYGQLGYPTPGYQAPDSNGGQYQGNTDSINALGYSQGCEPEVRPEEAQRLEALEEQIDLNKTQTLVESLTTNLPAPIKSRVRRACVGKRLTESQIVKTIEDYQRLALDLLGESGSTVTESFHRKPQDIINPLQAYIEAKVMGRG